MTIDTINDLDDFIKFGKKAFGVELTIKKSDNPDTYEKLFGTTKNDLGVDAVSRQAAIDAIRRIHPIDTDYDCTLYDKVDVMYVLNDLPSVTPREPKTGHWFIDERPESNREVICSNCEQPLFKYHKLDFDYRPKYCPNCGCRMIEPQENEKA